jgi:hypothetical protein
MEYVKGKHSNFKFAAGPNPSTNDLDVTKTVAMLPDHPNPVPFTVIEAELTQEEIEKLIKTKRIFLCIMGEGMPPVRMTVNDPIEEEGYIPVDQVKRN